MRSTSGPEPLILLQRQPAGLLVNFSTPPCVGGHRRMLSPFENVPLYAFFSLPPLPRKPRNTEIHSRRSADLAQSGWYLNKKKLFSEQLPGRGRERHACNSGFIYLPTQSALEHIFVHRRGPRPWKFLLPSQGARGARRTMIIVTLAREEQGESGARHAGNCARVKNAQ